MEPAEPQKPRPENRERLLALCCALVLCAGAAVLLLVPGGVLHAVAPALVLLGLGLGLARQTLALRRAGTRLEQLEQVCVEQEAHGLAQARLAGVLRAASHMSIISTDRDGVIQVFNSGAEKILGYSAGELVGKATPESFHLPAETEAYAQELSARLGRPVAGFEAFVALAREGGPLGRDTRQWTYVRKDGGHVPVELTVTGIYSDAGELEGYLGVGQDLTAGKVLEAELRQAQVSVDSAGDMILWAALDDARVVFANQAACDILGYSREEFRSITVLDMNPRRTLESWRAHGELLRAKGRRTIETTLRRKDGSTVAVESSSTLVTHEGVQYSVGILRDITARKTLEAELRQAQISVDSAGDMISWVRLADGSIAYVNATACRILGYARGELLGANIRLVNPWRTEAELKAAVAALREQGRITFEADYRRKDGTTLPVETKATLVEHEGVEYAVGIARDISARRADENRIRLETRLNQSLAETARALIGAAPDMNAVAGLLLDRACELTGSRHGYVAFIDQESGGMHPRAMSAMMKSGECALGALPVTFPVGPDGVYPGLWGHSLNTRRGFIENSPQGRPGAVGLPKGHVPINQLLTMPAVIKNRLVGQIALANPGRDYTPADLEIVTALADIFALGAEQILSQKVIVAAKEEAETSSRSKSIFLANMTHEVRTPLNGILGMLQVLQLSGLDPEQREYAAIAQQSAERLNLLLNNVIDYARLDSATEAPAVQAFPLTDLLQALRAAFEPQAREKGLELIVQAAPELPELVRADHQALRQALTHLLDNAVKFTPAGQVLLSASLAPDNPDQLVFRVEDSGIGIPPEKRQQVFQAFVQADSSFTRTFGGAGLGLAIVRKLAERQGGSVEAQDRPGGGTVMLLTIPLHSPAPSDS